MTCENAECGGDIISIYVDKAYRRGVGFAINDEWQDHDDYGPDIKGTSSVSWRENEERENNKLFGGDIDFMFCLKCHKIQGMETLTVEELRARHKSCESCGYKEEDCECNPV